MKRFFDYIEKQISEISADPILRAYGAFLGLSHLITFYFWVTRFSQTWSLKSASLSPVCWPYFSNCEVLQFETSFPLTAVYIGYLFLALPATFLFLRKNKTHLAFWFLATATIIKVFILSTRYIYLGNYHYMAFWTLFVFLLIPDKRRLLPILIAGFYVAAGTLKFNMEWLSGAALIQAPPMTGLLLSLSLFYVVLLECVLIFGLLSQNKLIRSAVLIQLLAFHAMSWHFVGYYYPLMMGCILSLFVLTLKNQKDLLGDLFQLRLQKSAYVVLIVFIVAQLIPKVFSKDPSLGGLLRIPSVTMFDSTSSCFYQFIKYQDEHTVIELKPFDTMQAIRVRCDPLVFLSQLRGVCQDDPQGVYDFSLYTKRSTDKSYKTVLDLRNVCTHKARLLWSEVFQGGQ